MRLNNQIATTNCYNQTCESRCIRIHANIHARETFELRWQVVMLCVCLCMEIHVRVWIFMFLLFYYYYYYYYCLLQFM